MSYLFDKTLSKDNRCKQAGFHDRAPYCPNGNPRSLENGYMGIGRGITSITVNQTEKVMENGMNMAIPLTEAVATGAMHTPNLQP